MLELKNGRFELKSVPPTVQKLVTFLSKAGPIYLYTSSDVSELAMVGLSTLTHTTTYKNPLLTGMTEVYGGVRYWGSAQAIAALRQQVAV